MPDVNLRQISSPRDAVGWSILSVVIENDEVTSASSMGAGAIRSRFIYNPPVGRYFSLDVEMTTRLSDPPPTYVGEHYELLYQRLEEC